MPNEPSEKLKACPFCKVLPKRESCFGMDCVEHPANGCCIEKTVIRFFDWQSRHSGELDEEKVVKYMWDKFGYRDISSLADWKIFVHAIYEAQKGELNAPKPTGL